MHRRALVSAMTVTVSGLSAVLVLAGPAMASPVGPSGTGTSSPSATVGVSDACDAADENPGGTVSCSAVELDNPSGWRGHHIRGGGATTANVPSGYGPVELQQAYNLTAASASNGRGKTVAIVDAYDDPFALSDLATYRAEWNLPPLCTGWTTRGCVTFTKVNQRGATWPLPSPDPGWSQEISVDLDMVSATCPNCDILLVEASAATIESLGAAEDTAAAAGPVSIGNSFGVTETASETSEDRHFSHAGIAITAATGDDGYGTQYPAASPDVIAVGGTTLTTATGTSRGWSETAWAGDGSGCSTVEPQAVWQSKVSAVRSACSERAVADVSAVADPDTGVAVYDSFGLPGWSVFGGTSVSAQIISAVYALASAPAGSGNASGLYRAAPGNFFDVTSGSDGTCNSDLCTAQSGWDGPTGLGTPDGAGAF
jgi:subtilase family serine protease